METHFSYLVRNKLKFKEIYNRKIFLLPDAINSMAAAHAKIYPDKNQYQLRISDCNSAIKLWGDITSKQDKLDAISKLENLAKIATDLSKEIKRQLK